MTTRMLKHTGILAIVIGLAVGGRVRAAQTNWSTLAPAGAGFSIEMPGTADANQKPDHFVSNAGDWAFFVTVSANSDALKELVGAADRTPIKQYLETIHKSFLRRAKERTSSDADFNGYPSIRFSADGETDDKQAFQGKYWLVVTEEHTYMLMAIGPKGPSNADADRFLDSFRLVTTAPASANSPVSTAVKGGLAAKLQAPMLAVAIAITEEQLNPLIDQMVQRVQSAQRLGSRWNATHPAWQKARTTITRRVDLLSAAYDETGEMGRTFAAAAARVAPGSQADAVVAALNGPAGPEIIREHALIEFATTLMADDPNGPNPGERAWMELMASMSKKFDLRLGAVMPRDPAHEAEAGKMFSTPTGELLRSLWGSVVGKAVSQLKGAVNLALFDDREAIAREIEAVIATVK
jgi:hypothetical protein